MDESEVTDYLAAAVDWYDGHYPFTDAREDKHLDEYELPVPTLPVLTASQPAGVDR